MSRPGRTALWQNLLRDNQKPASALDAVISVILPNGTNGTHLSATHPSRSSRCPELASSYYLCHYRPTSACFCHRLYTSARRSSRSSRSACSACSAAPASQPARRLLCLLCLLCSIITRRSHFQLFIFDFSHYRHAPSKGCGNVRRDEFVANRKLLEDAINHAPAAGFLDL